ncbi:type II toxin-antitoxin system VapC family toxin [Microcoleus vaginatus]|uniref:type II toxin-antitoxin system VapC family toxin n=1 Tax=Microcoleus vaginatus TaxID=119532 RepID=UPI0016842822|nr:type II toxin-antitoxin system VapC family toxin [Microcoleus sp. FACHB-84]MBD2011068.1 type II toxin-antitoxin system VapC family toxin [Microcoleus sp. FACHB-45]
MNIILDTHTLLWYLEDSKNLSSKAAEIIEEPSNTLRVSIASLWEISIKLGLGKLSLQNSFSELEEVLKQLKIEVLPITFSDTECYLNLPLHHRDPFDRILVAQAINHSLVLVSRDVAFDAYDLQRLWS